MEKASHILTRILLGGKLEDKLAGAKIPLHEIEWDTPAFQMPEEPGREGNLKPVSSKTAEKNAFPKKSELKNDSARGKLLHFFANHELLAIETMAYTLLKFPDAPLEFKKGVMKTIQDEQRHMSLYLDRMHEYGVDLGGVSLNLYFWNILKTMRTPLDFVTRMSLTFEQANLDFALEYAKLFEEEIADEKTAKLLRVVHDDEVKHVAHGLKWFNEWREPNETEFDSYQKLLPFPLTPRRGKGGSRFFAAQSRKDAGFSEDYVLSMKVAGGSRGKVPDYFLFNPQCEIESQVSLSVPARAKIADLAPLMLWLAQEDDVVELPKKPNLAWLSEVYDLKGELPEMVYAKFGEAVPPSAGKYIAFEELKPWGWGESAWKRLSEVKEKLRKPPQFSKEDPLTKFFSKAWWKNELKSRDAEVFGRVLSSEKVFEEWQSENAAPEDRFLLKAAVSTSGRGHLEFSKAMLADSVLTEKIKKRIQSEGSVVIEPLLKKKIDFSIQYEIFASGEVKFEEPRFFLIDSHYQYQGALLGNWGGGTRYETEWRLIRENLRSIREQHQKAITILKEQNYVGPVGIDCLIYEAPDQMLKIAPLIEVNVRFTMGRVANEIERALGRKGGQKQAFWSMVNKSRLGPGDLDREFQHWMPTTPFEDAQSTWSVVIWDHSILTEGKIEEFIRKC
jgi:uncharacterized ferritin-like protein (DUF455 family)